jgi:hypothetical protein
MPLRKERLESLINVRSGRGSFQTRNEHKNYKLCTTHGLKIELLVLKRLTIEMIISEFEKIIRSPRVLII